MKPATCLNLGWENNCNPLPILTKDPGFLSWFPWSRCHNFGIIKNITYGSLASKNQTFDILKTRETLKLGGDSIASNCWAWENTVVYNLRWLQRTFRNQLDNQWWMKHPCCFIGKSRYVFLLGSIFMTSVGCPLRIKQLYRPWHSSADENISSAALIPLARVNLHMEGTESTGLSAWLPQTAKLPTVNSK